VDIHFKSSPLYGSVHLRNNSSLCKSSNGFNQLIITLVSSLVIFPLVYLLSFNLVFAYPYDNGLGLPLDNNPDSNVQDNATNIQPKFNIQEGLPLSKTVGIYDLPKNIILTDDTGIKRFQSGHLFLKAQ
jgi:hypothetical protein